MGNFYPEQDSRASTQHLGDFPQEAEICPAAGSRSRPHYCARQADSGGFPDVYSWIKAADAEKALLGFLLTLCFLKPRDGCNRSSNQSGLNNSIADIQASRIQRSSPTVFPNFHWPLATCWPSFVPISGLANSCGRRSLDSILMLAKVKRSSNCSTVSSSRVL